MEKKKRAALAAVMYYLACEKAYEAESAEAGRAAEAAAAEATQPSEPGVQAWALSGRQAQMQMRTMMQMKAFHL